MARISDNVREILERHLQIDSAKKTVRVTSELEPDLYQQVAGLLVGLGGKYAGVHAKGTGRHAFKEDPAPLIEMVLVTGEDNPGDFFATPEPLADYLAACLDVTSLPPGGTILEPSYGTGRLMEAAIRAARAAGRYDLTFLGIEENAGLVAHAQRLTGPGRAVYQGDVLQLLGPAVPIHAAIMNPPFGKRPRFEGDWGDKNVYIRHILRVWSWLPPGGRLVAVAPTGWTFHDRGKAVQLPGILSGDTRLSTAQFRAFVERYGRHVTTRDKLFEATGIPVTVIVLGTEPGSPPPMPELPEELRPAQRRSTSEPTDTRSLDEIMHDLRALERESARASADLMRSLAGVLGYPVHEAMDTPASCPGCTLPVEAEDVPLIDAGGRPWHEPCALTALADARPSSPVEDASVAAALDGSLAGIENLAARAVLQVEAVGASLQPPRRGRQRSAPGQLAFSFDDESQYVASNPLRSDVAT